MTNDQQACREAFEKSDCNKGWMNGHVPRLVKNAFFEGFEAAWNARAPQPAADEVNDDIIADALYAFLRERSAQMGERFTRQSFDGLRAEQPESFEEDLVSMRCALRAAIAAMSRPADHVADASKLVDPD